MLGYSLERETIIKLLASINSVKSFYNVHDKLFPYESRAWSCEEDYVALRNDCLKGFSKEFRSECASCDAKGYGFSSYYQDSLDRYKTYKTYGCTVCGGSLETEEQYGEPVVRKNLINRGTGIVNAVVTSVGDKHLMLKIEIKPHYPFWSW